MQDECGLGFSVDEDDSASFGDEGFDISHEGGEYQVFANIVQELARVGIGQWLVTLSLFYISMFLTSFKGPTI